MPDGISLVKAAGVQIATREWGGGDPILMIHGAASDMGTFEPTVVPLLAPDFRLIAYDRPGLGRSADRPPRAETLEVQAAVAAGVLDAVGIGTALVLAHSYGGAVALRLALDRPKRVKGLVLIAPAANDWPGGVAWHYHVSSKPVVGPLFNHLLTRPFVEAAARAGLAQAFSPAQPPERYFEATGVLRATRPTALAANAEDVAALKQEVRAQAHRYGEIAAPTGLLVGDSDGVVLTPLHGMALARTMPRTRLTVIPNGGHLPHEQDPAALQTLVKWVAGDGA